MSTDITSKDMRQLLGLTELEPLEEAVFIANLGDLILEQALVALIMDFNEGQMEALDYYLSLEPSSEDLLKYLLKSYPQFEAILMDQIIAFKEEAEAIMPPVANYEVVVEAVPQSRAELPLMQQLREKIQVLQTALEQLQVSTTEAGVRDQAQRYLDRINQINGRVPELSERMGTTSATSEAQALMSEVGEMEYFFKKQQSS